MALWLVRAGSRGEHEQYFLDTNKVYVTWENLKQDLSKLATKQDLQQVLRERDTNQTKGKINNNSGQLWPFVNEMKPGDWIVVPSKLRPAIHIAEITGQYTFDPTVDSPYFHQRAIKWVVTDIPRSNFDQDLLYSFGAFMTICKIERNDAESRIRSMAKTKWLTTGATIFPEDAAERLEVADTIDLEQIARDQIARLIIRKFKGHGMEVLIEAVLKAQGYTTYHSPEGRDKGVDILAASGRLGFERPRICVQVKSSDSPVDLPTLNQLIGSMQNVHADQGLLVSWGGFKSSVLKELPTQFFRVRLWDQDDVIRELLANYDKLDEELKAELPLKRIWTVTTQSEVD
jgi:restriction system protein